MNATIWKYPLQMADDQIVKMPTGAKILAAQFQQDELCLWALVNGNPTTESAERKICIFGTGNWIGDTAQLVFIGTAQRWPMVWHVFEDITT